MYLFVFRLGCIKFAFDLGASRQIAYFFVEDQYEVEAIALAGIGAHNDALATVFFTGEVFRDTFEGLVVDVTRLDVDYVHLGDSCFLIGGTRDAE